MAFFHGNRVVSGLIVLFAIGIGFRANLAEEPHRLGLEGSWQLRQSGVGEAIPATVPGCVHTDLLAAGKISDPFYRDNEARLQWIGEAAWTYSRTFDVAPEFLKHEQIKLRCEGLDTLATIKINGQKIARTNNMFRTWEFDVRSVLKSGSNTIEITFDPAVPWLKARVQQAAFPGLVLAEGAGLDERGLLRKEQCNFGWDWGPKLITCGIWRKIGLLAWDQARLSGVVIGQNHQKDGLVRLDVDIAAETSGSASLTAETTVSFQGKTVAQARQPLRDDGVGRATLDITRPQLWWPAGMGAQNLYDVRVELRNRDGERLDRTDKRIGLRTIQLYPKTDRRPLGLGVNGRPFFAKGSNWIPPEVFATKVTPELLRRYMTDAVASNMNMLRFWGGGYYEEDELFDLCDELGILIWLDLKFACYAYPGFDPAFRDSIRAEVRDNVLRLDHHPSIAVWCGNNEVRELATAERWKPDAMAVDDYDRVFHGLVAGIVKEIDPHAVYTPGSPESGDDHYWKVWHGGRPFEAYETTHGMMTEFGFQSFAEPRTVEAFTTPEDRASVQTDIMRWHQRNGGVPGSYANQRIVDLINRSYRPAKDFDSTLWLSQISQAQGIGRAIEHWRRDWPNSTGSLVWQYNDCWPVTSWSSVDYFGRWKALQYRLRHAYAPRLVSSIVHSKGEAEIFVSSDLADSSSAAVEWVATDVAGRELRRGTLDISVPAGTCSISVGRVSLAKEFAQFGSANLLLWLRLVADGRTVSENIAFFDKPKWLKLVDPRINASVKKAADGSYAVDLQAAHPALWTWIDFHDLDARYSDNFVHLAPGKSAQIVVAPSKTTTIEELRKKLRVRSLFDTFDPEASFNAAKLSADGAIVASAADADILGSAAYFGTDKPAYIQWNSDADRLMWKIPNAKPGVYDVWIDAAYPSRQPGGVWEFSAGGQKLTGNMPGGKKEDEYGEAKLGSIRVDHPGKDFFLLRAIKLPKTGNTSFRGLTLRPRKD